MYEVVALVEILTSSEGGIDYAKMRELCKSFNLRGRPVFNTDGTDQELLESVLTYLARILKKL